MVFVSYASAGLKMLEEIRRVEVQLEDERRKELENGGQNQGVLVIDIGQGSFITEACIYIYIYMCIYVYIRIYLTQKMYPHGCTLNGKGR